MKTTIAEPSSDKLDSTVWKVVGVVLLGPLMAQMDSTIVNVSLSSIRDALHATLASAQWVISGYLVALALMLPLNGWIVDRLGAKRLYLVCFTLFTLTSVLCGAATNMDQLIGARLLQGFAGGLLAPLAQLMLARVAGRHMARVIGYAATPVLLAPTLGPIAAGAILKYLSWSWLFYVNLPIGLLAIVLSIIVLPKDKPILVRRSFDTMGFLLISPGLCCLLYGFEQLVHGEGGWICLIGVILLLAFIRHARRKKATALIDLDLFKNKIFKMATITQFLTNGVLYAGQFLIPLYLTIGCGLTADKVGWLLAPMGVGMILVYPMMGFLTDKFGCRAVTVTGILVNAIGTIPFLWMTGQSQVPYYLIGFSLFLRGVGQGATGIPTIAAAYASVSKEELGLATTAINIVQRLGGPVATTAIAILVSTNSGMQASTSATSFLYPFVGLVALQLLVLFPAAKLPLRIHQST